VDDFDLVVIGAGPAGEKGAAQAAYFGKRVAIVDREARPGGAAALDAWVPSKSLREAALYLTGFRRRDVYAGLSLGLDPAFAVTRLRDRWRAVVDTITSEVGANIDAHGIELVHGAARLGPDRTVHVTLTDGGTRDLRGQAIIIATGSRPYHPTEIDFDDPDVVDSTTVLDIDHPVRSMLVVGGGAVGCEYASIFCAIGTEVTLVDSRDHLVPMMDHAVSEGLAEALRGFGVHVLLDTGHPSVTRDEHGLVVHIPGHGVLRPEKVLYAAGRAGNSESLGLEELGIQVDGHGGILVNEAYETDVPGVYAAGDVLGPPALASVSMEQGRVAACHAFDIHFKEMVDPLTPIGVYSIPEAGGIGMAEHEAEAAGIDYEIGIAPFSRSSRAIISGSTDGFVKLVFRREDKVLLGVHVLGDSATELVHQGQAVLSLGGTIDQFIQAVYNVPTLSETYKYAAYDGLQRLARTEAGTGDVRSRR